jgi:hypothetical protein
MALSGQRALKTVIVYPIPVDSSEVWTLFRPFVQRFADSLRQFDPGCEYEIAAVMNHDDPGEEMNQKFEGLPVKYHRYDGFGFDIGSFQWYAHHCPEPCFMVCCVTRVYAWREGWLKALVDARSLLGPGLYGTSVSREGGKLHCCTRCYAFDSEDFKRYPHQIVSRDQGTFFEVYDGNVLDWFVKEDLEAHVVYWDGPTEILDSNDVWCFAAPEIFRKGQQSNLLIKDRHTLLFDEASPEEKIRLARMCYEGKD